MFLACVKTSSHIHARTDAPWPCTEDKDKFGFAHTALTALCNFLSPLLALLPDGPRPIEYQGTLQAMSLVHKSGHMQALNEQYSLCDVAPFFLLHEDLSKKCLDPVGLEKLGNRSVWFPIVRPGRRGGHGGK